MKNGDKLFGKIQNRDFALNSSYGEIVCSNDFLKAIDFDENKPDFGSFQTINNDRFSGSLRKDEVEIILEDGEQRSINKQIIKKVRLDARGPSYEIVTAIISMQNGDKFSGKVLTESFKVKSGYMVRNIQRDSINRFEMSSGGEQNAKFLLRNGDVIRGDLLLDRIDVAPDSIRRISLNKKAIRAVQFNANKMVLSQFSPSNTDIKASSHTLVQDTSGGLDDTDQIPETNPKKMTDARAHSDTWTVFFDFDRYDLQREFYADLDHVASMLSKDPAMKIQIQGHTDNIGTPEYNMKLSEKRAGEVKGYLLSKGINSVRISTIGYGYTKNKASNNTTDGRAQNRRAEIVLVE
jgi:outer membrane protein OmpA-like peptidoglycan-associated protein